MMAASELETTELGQHERPTLVLLHGAGMGRWMWQPQLESLAAHFHVLAPDLPGCAGSVASGPFTLKGATAAVADLIRARSHGPAHLVGLSLGAMVAVQLCQYAPELVASLVLSGGQVHPNPLVMTLQEGIITCMPERMVTDPVPASFARRYPELVEVARSDARRMGKHGLLAVLRAAGHADHRKILPTIAVPTLVLCGGKDRVNLPAARQLAAGIPGAELRVVPGAGHVWNLEQPEVFTRTVIEFVHGVNGPVRMR
jgi:3-oxoadipate enol-lactonase